MAWKDLRVQLRNFAAARRFQEIGKVAFALAGEGADELALEIEQRSAGDDSLGPDKNPAPSELRVERFGLQPARLRHDGLAAKIVDDHLGVRRLRGVRITETPAVTDDGAAQPADAEAPAANIRRVNVVVA